MNRLAILAGGLGLSLAATAAAAQEAGGLNGRDSPSSLRRDGHVGGLLQPAGDAARTDQDGSHLAGAGSRVTGTGEVRTPMHGVRPLMLQAGGLSEPSCAGHCYRAR